MCYRLFLASPLTLTEIRSMLPGNVVAHLVPAGRAGPLLDLLPMARDVVELTAGGCACDLAGRRLADPEEDGRRLRARYRARGTPRSQVIRDLERHRIRPAGRGRRIPTPRILADFVAEHGRNAGPALYYLRFTADPDAALEPPPGEPVRIRVARVLERPGDWLQDETPTLVVPLTGGERVPD